jgi:tetratricopeptide (TPR) repeat protein
MLRICFLFLLSLFVGTSLKAQSKESIKQMMEKAKKEIEDDPDMDQQQKTQLLRMMNSKGVQNGVNLAEAHSDEMERMMKQTEKLTGLPQQNSKRIASIPKSVLSKEECRNYIQNLTSKLETQLSSHEKTLVQNIIQQTGHRSSSMTTAAVALWYNKNPDAALFLALKAAQPDSVLALSNAGAMLNQLGYEEKAVPLLQYALTKDSSNSNILNNLGRAYLGLGETQKAKTILLSCVQVAPMHPEANNMLGCLYEAEGNKTAAENHYRQSLEGGFNKNAHDHLQKLQPDFDLVVLISKHYKAPEYFNQFRIQIPRECYSIDEAPQVKAEHEAFEKGLELLSAKYLDKENSSYNKTVEDANNLREMIATTLEQGKAFSVQYSPLNELAGLMLLQLAKNYDNNKLRVEQDYEATLKELKQNFEQEAAKTKASIWSRIKRGPRGEEGMDACLNCDELRKEECEQLTRLANETQRKAADLHNLFKDRYRRIALDFYDDFLYWNHYVLFSRNNADAAFYDIIVGFLKDMITISSTTPYPFYSGCKEQKPVHIDPSEQTADKKLFCPVNISVPFLIGKMNFDCTSFSISAGEGVKGEFKKDFSNGQSTISIGAGVSVEGGVVSAGADESIYITFNGDNQPSDIGIKWDASGQVSIGGLSTSAHSGYTVGMNSGWDFTSGALGEDIHL